MGQITWAETVHPKEAPTEKRPAMRHATGATGKDIGRRTALQPILSSKDKAKETKDTVEAKDTAEAKDMAEEKDTEAKEAREKDGEKERDREKAKAASIHSSS